MSYVCSLIMSVPLDSINGEPCSLQLITDSKGRFKIQTLIMKIAIVFLVVAVSSCNGLGGLGVDVIKVDDVAKPDGVPEVPDVSNVDVNAVGKNTTLKCFRTVLKDEGLLYYFM